MAWLSWQGRAETIVVLPVRLFSLLIWTASGAFCLPTISARRPATGGVTFGQANALIRVGIHATGILI